MKKDYEIEFYKTEIERLKLELEIEKSNKGQMPNEMKDQVNEIVEIASDMRNILNECRYEQININLAKKIDYVLKRCRYLD